jgi:hypothetical protein
MIVNRKTTQIKLGNGDIVHRVLLESIECPAQGEKAKLVKHKMLEQICSNPDLAVCGTLDFETFLFKYIADKWVIELKATEKVQET